MKLKKVFGALALATTAGIALAACAPSSSSSNATSGSGSSKETTLRVGVMTLNDTSKDVWTKVAEKVKSEGVKIELKEYTDYTQPNKALNQDEVDVNAFQHIYFLNNWNKENKADLQIAGYTIYTPIRLYSGVDGDKERYSKVEDIPNGAKVGIPNDATNESRALYLLEQAGLIKLKVENNGLATKANITENSKNLDIQEVSAEQLVRARGSLDAAVINTNYAQQGGIDVSTAIFVEKPSDITEQWYNIIAAKKGWESSDKADAIKKLVAAYNSEDIAKIYEEKTKGAEIPIWDSVKK
ncbi:MetQ/NlpA family ABC transporter substrate-binding protein [Streptococcus sp. DD13]|uniref:MetQ/NlpA family ABC transporter substrate-binding protein n=1 Tax=Streptococcus sp. DD13 TaxID=1777881 RepID=UPI00079C139C|nr:MetQ/NlpA family ABC transporter substrate-binding protein [Streptococcus sp. DD13]KXT78135.1 Methionine ABC transporter substrate-binding protein [Streptococcus sp. DD13]